ncbi:MAG: SUMF1/EgtB/PvdO family nonheme iron enzyme [Planctomycetes bacterium]|nr:SUMF1/EgtB/PvdO family nonheme iron enzyme [Planctomycetota bacterium]MBI3846928.1 SUMF1/EgtB/PvdO family nonheme iron enzyme [Planctomycetota bacterium]
MSPKNPEIDRILQEFVDRRALGESPSPEEYEARYPHLAEELRTYFATLETLDRCVIGRGASPPNETVLGDFRIVRELGRGGMGVVFLAEQVSLHRLVALKLLGTPSTQRYETVERFRREAEIAARLHHPNLVSVYAVGERQGYCFFAMEYVEGVTLARLLARLREFGAERLADVDVAAITAELAGAPTAEPDATPTPPPTPTRHFGYFGTVARIVAELADGLAYAHARGVIHRDVKPSNILLTRELAPQLADFGIARDLGQKTLSLTGDLVGTPYYMSPELAMAGRIPVDHRTDVYSLGVTLFEMLALAVPFPGSSSAEVLRKILLEPTPSPRRFNSRVPRDLQVIALKAMEKDPGHRYANANEMAEDLRRFLRFEPILARTPGPVVIAARFLKRHRVGVATTVALLISASTTGAYVVSKIKAARLETRIEEARDLTKQGTPESPWPWLRAEILWRSILDDTGGTLAEASVALDAVTRDIRIAKERFVERGTALLAGPGNLPTNHLYAGRAFDSALRLLGDDPVGNEAANIRSHRDAAWGFRSVTITSNPPGAPVDVHPIDDATGDILFGLSISRESSNVWMLHDGSYWIVVGDTPASFAEYEWIVSSDPPSWTLEARLRRTDDVVQGMIAVPAGQYRVGMPVEEPNVPQCELPVTDVSVPAFYIDRTEVSNEEYARFVRETGHAAPKSFENGQPQNGTERKPVVNVTWFDACAYAQWAGKRLPTEIEWEITARGPAGFVYPYGNDYRRGVANVLDGDVAEAGHELVDVDAMPESASRPFGAVNMVGNADEWVRDPWRPRPGTESTTLANVGQRTLRGGSFQYPKRGEWCTGAWRRPWFPKMSSAATGFRCAKSVRP